MKKEIFEMITALMAGDKEKATELSKTIITTKSKTVLEGDNLDGDELPAPDASETDKELSKKAKIEKRLKKIADKNPEPRTAPILETDEEVTETE